LLILGLNGSPHREGNTVALLQAALQAAGEIGAETRILHVAEALKGVDQPFCTACTPNCETACAKDTNLIDAFEIMKKADGIIMGSPVHFGSLSAQLKAFWDKSRALRNHRSLVNVVGGAVSVGTSRFGGQEKTIGAMHDIMLVQGMTVVGDGFFDDDAGHHGACAQKPAAADQNGLNRAAIMGRRVAELAEATIELRRR